MTKELDYMAKTIRSSWEFLDVTFTIRNVSRACAQQITRTRFTPIDGDLFGSYAMQSQRVTDMSAMGWHNPYETGDALHEDFEVCMIEAMSKYSALVEDGSKLEDARGVLPVNLHCNLIAKYNLRMLVDLVQKRESYRAQGEYNVIAREMREALVEMWPWAELFLRPKNELAKAAVEDLKASLRAGCNESNVGRAALHDIMIKLAKVDDILQGE
jgi:flavin-dependent thymidylate synthase